MTSVDIGVCHDDDTAISKLRRVKVCADATLERLNERLDFFERKHLIKPALFNIQQFSTQRKNCLMHVIASAFGTSTCTIAFDDKNFSGFDIIA